jgi:hypothetical protein
MGPRLWESFQDPLTKHHARLLISFSGINLFFTKDFAPFSFLWSWALVVLYLCSRFYIFDRPILEEYVYQVEGAHTCFNHA